MATVAENEQAKQEVAKDKRNDIRAWAKENNVPCPSRGRIPQRVMDAYHAAATELLNRQAESEKRRLVVRFDPETLSFWPESVIRKTPGTKLRATVLHYVENTGARTPSPANGKFVSQRFTVKIDGEKWVGQVKNGTDVVRLRPYDEAYGKEMDNG